MSYEAENLHQLHLLNFNSLYETKSRSVKKQEICQGGRSYNTKAYIEKRQYPFGAQKNAKFIKRSSSETSTRTRRSPGVRNTLNRIFRKAPIRPSNKRSLSLNDIRQKLSSSSLLITESLKRTLQSHTFLKRKRKKEQNVCPIDELAKEKKLQVLFTSKRSRSMKKQKHRKDFEDCKRLDLFYDSKSSGDVFGFNSNNNCSPHFCYHLFECPNRRCFQVDKWDYQNSYHQNNKAYRKYNIECINNYTPGSYGYTMPVHYNLVDFPCTNPRGKEATASKKCVLEEHPIDSCPCINEPISVTPSCLPKPRKDAGDTGIVHKFAKENRILCKRKRCSDHTKSKFFSLTFDLPRNPVSLARATLKYILFGFAIIVWSPCIITLGLYWIITYPLRPQHIFKEDEKINYNCCSCFNYGNEFFRSIFQAVVRVAKKVNNALNSLFKKQRPESSQCLKPCLSGTSKDRHSSGKKERQIYPNPKNKYTLYYTRHKGWIMKPIKKRRKSVNKRCECYPSEFPASESGTKKKVDKDCECHAEELVKISDLSRRISKRSISIGKSTKRKKLQPQPQKTPAKMISTRSSPIQATIKEQLPQNPSEKKLPSSVPIQSPLHKCECTTPSVKIKDRDTSPIRELETKKKPTPIIPARDKVINKNPVTKPCKTVSFKGNNPITSDPCKRYEMPRVNMREHFRPKKHVCIGRGPMDISGKINRDKIPCPCSWKNVNEKLKRPIVCIGRERPRQVNYKQYISKGKPLSSRQRLCCWCQSVRKNVREVINDVEGRAWKCDICDDMYVYTLRRRPWFWIYSYCPSFYPYFLIFYKFYENVVYAMMFIISTCIWCPILCWCYVCFTVFCRCLC